MRLPILLCQLLCLQISIFPQLTNKPSKDRNYEFYFSFVPTSTTTSPLPITAYTPTLAQESEENKHAEYSNDWLPVLEDNSPEGKTGCTTSTHSAFMVVVSKFSHLTSYSSFKSWHGVSKKGKDFEIAFHIFCLVCFFHPTGYSLLSQKESSASLSWIISGLPEAV